jgi:hypothetical protein
MPKREPEENFFRISHAVVESPEFLSLKPSAVKLYVVLCHLRNRYADKDGIFYRSDSDLVADTGMSKPTIVEARRELLQKGFLRWRKGKSHTACLYQINDFD